jgi:hypothetical protein
MKTQISKQHSNLVAVQPLTTAAYREDRMKNAHRIHVEPQRAVSQTTASRGLPVHRLSTMFAVAMSILLLGVVCSAQTNTYIPQYTAGGLGLTNSIMNQPSASQINVNNGSFNLSNSSTGFYQIGGNNVLGIGNSTSTASSIFVGPFAGYYNYTNSTGTNNTYVGNATGLNAEGSHNTYMGFSAGWSGSTASTGSRNTLVGEYAGASNTSGNENSAFGYLAGISNTTGSFNLYLAHPGIAAESNTIRIGNQGPQLKAYVAGIVNNTTTNPANVYISPSGQLQVGTPASGVSGTCGPGSGNFATWTSGTTLGCVTNLSDNGTTLTVTGSIAATGNVQANSLTASNVNAATVYAGGYSSQGYPGLSYTFHLKSASGGACTLIFTDGLLTGQSGTCT